MLTSLLVCFPGLPFISSPSAGVPKGLTTNQTSECGSRRSVLHTPAEPTLWLPFRLQLVGNSGSTFISKNLPFSNTSFNETPNSWFHTVDSALCCQCLESLSQPSPFPSVVLTACTKSLSISVALTAPNTSSVCAQQSKHQFHVTQFDQELTLAYGSVQPLRIPPLCSRPQCGSYPLVEPFWHYFLLQLFEHNLLSSELFPESLATSDSQTSTLLHSCATFNNPLLWPPQHRIAYSLANSLMLNFDCRWSN